MLATDDVQSDASARAAASAASSSAAGSGHADPAANARDLIHQATDDRGHVDTRQLASWVRDASAHDMHAASEAYGAIEAQLSLGDASRFNHDLTLADAPAVAGIGVGIAAAGKATLVKNPILVKQWVSTTSAWTGKSGFQPKLQQLLESKGIQVDPNVRAAPAGSQGRGSGVSSQVANNTNGALARDAIADEWRQQPGVRVRTEVPVQGGKRVVDVVVDQPAADPRMNRRIEIESKVGRQGTGKALIASQVENDAEALARNGAIRNGGRVLEGIGKVARPVGIALDAIQVGEAFHEDGDRIGVNTGRAASRVAGGALGGWGGAAAGAAIGTALCPGVGTVIGGVVGGVVGGLGGSAIAEKAFDTVKSWF
jgi:hypothetical protein